MASHGGHMELNKHAVVKGQVLMVCTSCNTFGAGGPPTGLWLGELAEPYWALKDAGWDITISSPAGGAVPIDEASLQDKSPEATRMLETEEAKVLLDNTVKLSDVGDPASYDCVFLPGGHGPMFDLAVSEALGELLTTAAAAGKLIAAVCHGPAGLLRAKAAPGGPPLVAGKRCTAFTDTEEIAVGKDKLVDFVLEAKLKELGADFQRTDDWGENVVVDGCLVTGQNPGSARKLGQVLVQLLDERRAQGATSGGGVTVTAGEAGLV